MTAFFSGDHVREAVSPQRAYDAVREAFIAYARGEWSMLPKVYVPAYPDGDFRAMPALGAGHALLKWVTSFPGNPAKGLPTVTGLVLLFIPDVPWYWGVAGLFVGYLLQYVGHRAEGNDVGEWAGIKRLLGLPYVGVSPRWAEVDAARAESGVASPV